MAPSAFTGAAARLAHPGTAYARPAPFALAVQPGDVELVRGDTLQISARPVGTGFPPDAAVEIGRVGEDRIDAVPARLGDGGLFAHTIPNVRETLRYRVVAGSVASAWHTATVVARPEVRGVQLTLRPPAYTRLPARRLDPGVGDVTALPGTLIEADVTLGGAPAAASDLVVEPTGADSVVVPLEGGGRAATGRFVLARSGAWRVRLRSADGVENAQPIRYRLGLLRDEPPQIALAAPGDAQLDERLFAPIQLRITDDFGFSRLTLYWRLAESRFGRPMDEPKAIALPLGDARQLDQQVLYDWMLRGALREQGLDLVPGDAIEYQIEVRDNDSYGGYKRARTPMHVLRLPSLAERFEEMDRAEEAATEQMREMREQSDQLRDQFQELRDELRRDQQPDWEDRRQLESLEQQTESLQQQAERLSEQMQDVLDQMEQTDMVSPETRELYEELQRVMEEIQSPELQEALQKLQEAMQEMDTEGMMEAMEDFEFSEEAYRERLERAIELFKRVQLAQELEEAAKRAEALAEQQDALAEQSEQAAEDEAGSDKSAEEQAADRERLAEEQEAAREEAEALQKELEELQEQMDELGRPAEQQQVDEAAEQAEQVPQQMQQAGEQIKQGEMKQASQKQKKTADDLKKMAQKLQQAAAQMQAGQQKADLAALRRSLDDVLTLSEEQERLAAESRAVGQDSPALRPIAQQQVDLAAGLATVADSLQTLARRVPKLPALVQRTTGQALREMEASTVALAERQAPQAAGSQKAAMTHLNDLALVLSEIMDQMQNEGEGEGEGQGEGQSKGQSLQQMLQQMGQQQQGQSDAVQQMLNDMAGQRMSQGAGERAKQLGAQQEALRRQLQNLIEQGGQPGADGQPGMDAQGRSELQRAAEEMEEAVRELREGRVTRQAAERQQQILERLLQAERSMNQRGKDNQREGQRGTDRRRDAADALPPPDPAAEQLRRDLIRALEAGYAPDYQDLIKRYFERLQNARQPATAD